MAEFVRHRGLLRRHNVTTDAETSWRHEEEIVNGIRLPG